MRAKMALVDVPPPIKKKLARPLLLQQVMDGVITVRGLKVRTNMIIRYPVAEITVVWFQWC